MKITIAYGTGPHEFFTVESITVDQDGEPWDGMSHVDFRDENTGEGYALNHDQAVKLAQALIRTAGIVKRAGGRA